MSSRGQWPPPSKGGFLMAEPQPEDPRSPIPGNAPLFGPNDFQIIVYGGGGREDLKWAWTIHQEREVAFYG